MFDIILLGYNKNKSTEQQSFNGFDGQSENFFSPSSTHTPARRSYSRERLPNSLVKVRHMFKISFIDILCDFFRIIYILES